MTDRITAGWSTSTIVWLCRLVVGGVFIVSGVTKCIDPWGTIFKIEEYLQAWDWDVERGTVTVGALLLSMGEGLLGVMMLLGCYRRSVTWLLLGVMAMMLPLTIYIAIENPVSDCGCFGDFIIISNRATMWKNIVVTAALIYLAMRNRRVTGLFHPYSQWIVGTVVTLYMALVSFWGYLVQPVIDFRRFDIGETIATAGGDSNDDEITYDFIYSKEGVEKAFRVDSLPDSTWTFVDRRAVGGSDQKSTSADDGLPVYSDGEEVTDSLIEGDVAIVAVPEPSLTGLGAASMIERVAQALADCDIKVVGILGGGSEIVDEWTEKLQPSVDLYYAEPTTLKELARGPVSLTILHDGRVEWKRSLDTLTPEELKEQGCGDIDSMASAGAATFWSLTLFVTGILACLFVIDQTGKAITRSISIKRRRRKTSVTDNVKK